MSGEREEGSFDSSAVTACSLFFLPHVDTCTFNSDQYIIISVPNLSVARDWAPGTAVGACWLGPRTRYLMGRVILTWQ